MPLRRARETGKTYGLPIAARHHIVRFLLSTLLLAWLPMAAFAQDGPDPERAQRFVNIATKMFKKNDYEAALVALRKAEPLAEGTPAQAVIRFNIARVLQEWGKTDAAIAAYEVYLKSSDKGPRRTKAREAIEALAATRSGRLEVDCGGVKEATVIVEGFPEGDCPWQWDKVAPGTYPMRVLAPDYLPVRREVRVEPGKTARLMLTLRPRPVGAEAGGDGAVWPWVAGGVGVAAAGAGLAFHLAALSNLDEVEGMRPGSARDDLQDTYETQRTLAYVGYGVGAVGLGVAVALWLSDDAPTAWAPTGNGVLVRF